MTERTQTRLWAHPLPTRPFACAALLKSLRVYGIRLAASCRTAASVSWRELLVVLSLRSKSLGSSQTKFGHYWRAAPSGHGLILSHASISRRQLNASRHRLRHTLRPFRQHHRVLCHPRCHPQACNHRLCSHDSYCLQTAKMALCLKLALEHQNSRQRQEGASVAQPLLCSFCSCYASSASVPSSLGYVNAREGQWRKGTRGTWKPGTLQRKRGSTISQSDHKRHSSTQLLELLMPQVMPATPLSTQLSSHGTGSISSVWWIGAQLVGSFAPDSTTDLSHSYCVAMLFNTSHCTITKSLLPSCRSCARSSILTSWPWLDSSRMACETLVP